MSLASDTETRLLWDARPEHQLLINCARSQIDAGTAERIRRLAGTTIDWDYVLNLAARHHLLPLLYRNLDRTCAHNALKREFILLWAHFESVAHRNRDRSLELVRLVKHFETHGIFVIPYKGPIAAALFYGDTALREFGDLDFLVRREDLSRVCELLEADGYRTQTQRSPIHQRHHERNAKEYLYCRRKGPEHEQPTDIICLEPHWSITTRKYPFPIDYSGLWRRAQRIEFHGAQLLSFAPQDAILILCVVGSKSQWKRLLMLCDFAEAIRTYSNIDWLHCLEWARELGCERMLLTAILLASELLDSTPSHELVERARADRKVVRLAQDIHDRFFEDIRPSVSRPLLFSPLLWRLRERPSDRVKYLLRSLTTPQGEHFRRMPLPQPLFPLYRLIVPIHDYLLRPAWTLGKRCWYWASSRGKATVKKEAE